MSAQLGLGKEFAAVYLEALRGMRGIRCFDVPSDVFGNFSYFPILVGAQYPLSRDELYYKLRDKGIYSRRYFYPLISTMPMYRGLPSATHANLPVATRIAQEVLCLPIYPDLHLSEVSMIVNAIRES